MLRSLEEIDPKTPRDNHKRGKRGRRMPGRQESVINFEQNSRIQSVKLIIQTI